MSRLGHALLAIGLIAVCVALFLYSFERRSEEEWQRPSPQARVQQFLAAERLLLAQGVQVRHIDSLQQLAPADRGSVAVLPAGRGQPGADALQQVDDFLAAGGHLLIETETLELADPLLDHLQIERLEPDYDESDDSEDEDDDAFDEFEFDEASDDWLDHYRRPLKPLSPSHPDLLEVSWEGLPEPLLVSTRGGEALASELPSVFELYGPDGMRVLRQQRGPGLLTVVNDIAFAHNWRIGRHDNAEFLWQLLDRSGKPTEVLFFRVRNEGLAAWLRQNAAMVLASVALLLLLAGWQAAPRFGPLQAEAEPVRRRLGDHLLASGRFLWSMGERQRLLDSALRHTRGELYRHAPHLRLAPLEAQVQHLVERLSVPPQAARAIVAGITTGSIAGTARATEVASFVQMLRACRSVQLRLRPTLAKSVDPGPEH